MSADAAGSPSTARDRAIEGAVTSAVLREVAGFRRSIEVDALASLMETLPIVIESALTQPELLRALAGEAEPTPAGDVPAVWWSPLFGPIEESKDRHGDKYVGFSRQSLMWVGLDELPADAVRLVPVDDQDRRDLAAVAEALGAPAEVWSTPRLLAWIASRPVPAGGPAPADEPDDAEPPTCPECGHASDHSGGECMWFDDYLVNGEHQQVTCKCPGSAPHQGATTDVTALLAHLDWLDERAMKGHHLLLRTDDVRALLAGKSIPIGPSADRALLGAGETTPTTPKETDHA